MIPGRFRSVRAPPVTATPTQPDCAGTDFGLLLPKLAHFVLVVQLVTPDTRRAVRLAF